MLIRKCFGREKFLLKKYNKQPIPNLESGNDVIRKLVDGDSPFLVARFGDGELRTVVTYIEKVLKLKKRYPDYVKRAICNNVGFSPCGESKIDVEQLLLN